jgi:putative ABC transport system permease protein
MEMGIIDESYFQTLGVPILRGRNFDASDKPGTVTKIIIDQRLADAMWPGENPIGKIILQGRAADQVLEERRNEVVGVVPTLALYGIREIPANRYQAYLAQSQQASGEMTFVLRTNVAPRSVLNGARAAVTSVDPTVPVSAAATMDEIIATGYASQTLYARLVVIFASFALLLAALGLNGVVAHAVASRRREIGIRMALGALQRQVVSLVLRQGAAPLALGLALGLAGALLAGRFVAGLLYHVSPYDPVSLAGAAVFLGVVGFVSLWLPARRAAKVDPMIALRSE